MERLPHEQQREYGNRVFYLSDYAGELLAKGGKYAAMWKLQAGLYGDVIKYA